MKSPIALYTDVEIPPLPDYRESLKEANDEDNVFCEEMSSGVRLTSLTAEQADMCSITSYSDSDYEAAMIESHLAESLVNDCMNLLSMSLHH